MAKQVPEMNRLLLLFTLLVVQLGVAVAAAETRAPDDHFFNSTFGDFSEELQIARDEGKDGIFIFFEMDECPFCHRMRTTQLNQVEVQDYYREHFRNFTVDIEGDLEITDFEGNRMKQKEFAFDKYRVRATPVLAFFGLDGELKVRHTGPTSTADQFLWLGEFFAEGHYKNTSFTRYKRQKRREQR